MPIDTLLFSDESQDGPRLLTPLVLMDTTRADLTTLPPSTKPRAAFFHIGYNIAKRVFDAMAGRAGAELTLGSNQEIQTYGWDYATRASSPEPSGMGGPSDYPRHAFGDVRGGPEEELVVALPTQIRS
jgi:hypothetical protein